MNYGLYAIFLGMRSRQNTLEIQANNIANASTTGFKADRAIYKSYDMAAGGADERQSLTSRVETTTATDFTAGSIQPTGRGLDIAIDGDAFLQIQTPRGIRYTRVGNLTQNNNGQLVTKNGDLVIGSGGPITVPRDGKLTIGEDGRLASDDKPLDKLKLVSFQNPATALSKEGDSLFMATGTELPQDSVGSRVVQGALENSNVNSISEMVAMISNNREFESLQKSLSLTMNDIGRKISGEIGKL